MNILPDKIVIQKLASVSREDNNVAITYLTKRLKFKVYKFLERQGANIEDQEDTFVKGLTELWLASQKGKIEEATRIEAYLFTICKNKWYKELAKRKNKPHLVMIPPSLNQESDGEVVQKIEEKERNALIKYILNKLDENCREILVLFYYQKLSLESIAEEIGYDGVNSVKSRKYTCMKKLKKIAKEYKGLQY